VNQKSELTIGWSERLTENLADLRAIARRSHFVDSAL
jgi:hypothetical protein